MLHPWRHFHPFVSAAALRTPPEWAHRAALSALRCAHASLPRAHFEARRQCMGMEFVNPIGLAAGLDKNAVALPAWQKCGFGFVEVGAVTPKAQPGNPTPRLFRLPEHQALINRMGFNNDGMTTIAGRLKDYRRRYDTGSMRIGVNLGKNKDTPLEQAAADYVALVETFWPLADYLCINVSSPNTPQLRALGQPRLLRPLLSAVAQCADRLRRTTGHDTALAVKIDPDQNSAQLTQMMEVLCDFPVRAVIATNTTCQRPAPVDATQAGGLSGPPLAPLALEAINTLKPLVRDSGIELIGSGGIDSQETARAFIAGGAVLLQLYTGFIYRGPQLIADLVSVFAEQAGVDPSESA